MGRNSPLLGAVFCSQCLYSPLPGAQTTLAHLQFLAHTKAPPPGNSLALCLGATTLHLRQTPIYHTYMAPPRWVFPD